MMAEKHNLPEAIGQAQELIDGSGSQLFGRVASRLLGGVLAYPAAWLRRPSQSFEDTTDARTRVAQGLADAVIAEAKQNPELMAAAAEAYLPTTVRRLANRAAVTAYAAIEVEQDPPETAASSPPDLDEDWLNQFTRYAEDASSERLQRLFGKILAGEIRRPGSQPTRLLRAIAELDQDTASLFEWAWSLSLGDSIWDQVDYSRGPAYLKIRTLRDEGLISETSVRHEPNFQPQSTGWGAPWSPMHVAGKDWMLSVWRSKTLNHKFKFMAFTPLGMSLGRLLPEPDYKANLIAAAQQYRGLSGVERILLISKTPSTPMEEVPV